MSDLLTYRREIDFNRARPEPLYYQIGASIADAVADRRIPAGVPVPPVWLLAEQLHIARSTARNVIHYLDTRRCIHRVGTLRVLISPPCAGDRPKRRGSAPDGRRLRR